MPTDARARPIVPPRRTLIVTTATAPQAELELIVRAQAGDDAEVPRGVRVEQLGGSESSGE